MLSQFSDLSHEMRVADRVIGPGHPTFFIAEIGNNHNGDYYIAKRLIKEAVAAGANAVKLQKRFIEDVFTAELRATPQTKDVIFGKTYGEYRQKLELNLEEFQNLKKFAESLGTIFFATPFDLRSVDFLEQVGVDVYKIASFDVTNLPLLSYIASKQKPIFLSSGMCTLEELDEAVNTILKQNNQLSILHCVSIYPTPDEALNLISILKLAERYAPLPVGYSGHEKDFLPTLSAIALGAHVIERHITLDRRMPGPDHGTVSIEPEEFKQMVEGARRIEQGLGTGEKRVLADEQKTRNKHSKSIVTRAPIAKGSVISADMLTTKSPGTGLQPKWLPQVVGKKVVRDLAADQVLQASDVEGL